MIRQDRELLGRAARVNRSFGLVVAELLCQGDGVLPAGTLRDIGHALHDLGTAFLARADELGLVVIDHTDDA